VTQLRVKLENQLTFNTVNDHLTQLHMALSAKPASFVVLDLQGITACDSAGLALLIEMKRWCKKQEKSLQIVDIPADVVVLAQFCGVEDLLQG